MAHDDPDRPLAKTRKPYALIPLSRLTRTISEARLTEDGFASVSTAHGAPCLRVNITAAQVPARIFVPIHWNDETSARGGALVRLSMPLPILIQDSGFQGRSGGAGPCSFDRARFVLVRTRTQLEVTPSLHGTLSRAAMRTICNQRAFHGTFEALAARSTLPTATYNDPRRIFSAGADPARELDAVLYFWGWMEKCQHGRVLPRHGSWTGRCDRASLFSWRAEPPSASFMQSHHDMRVASV